MATNSCVFIKARAWQPDSPARYSELPLHHCQLPSLRTACTCQLGRCDNCGIELHICGWHLCLCVNLWFQVNLVSSDFSVPSMEVQKDVWRVGFILCSIYVWVLLLAVINKYYRWQTQKAPLGRACPTHPNYRNYVADHALTHACAASETSAKIQIQTLLINIGKEPHHGTSTKTQHSDLWQW
jgi:hypothetical protein